MPSNKLRSLFLYSLLLAALTTAGYLLLQHFALATGTAERTNLCSAIFHRSCDTALLSRYSSFLSIPLGGWGILYSSILILCLLLGAWLPGAYRDNMLQSAFWLAVSGCAFSAFYLLQMAFNPVLLCPLCIVFHLLNFGILGVLKPETGKSLKELAAGLAAAFQFVLAGKQPARPFARWQWLGYLVLGLAGLVLYQRIRMEVLNQNMIQLASLDPLKHLEAFDTLSVHPFPLLPDEAILGPADAPVSLVVFSDFQCSACKLFAKNFSSLLEYNKGKLNIRFKYFPLSKQCNPMVSENFHPMACPAAWAAQAARNQRKFWPAHDMLFGLNLDKIDAAALLDSVQVLGLDQEPFRADFNSDSCRNRVLQDVLEGLRLGVESTPTVFLNGREVRDLRPDNLNFLIRYLLGTSQDH